MAFNCICSQLLTSCLCFVWKIQRWLGPLSFLCYLFLAIKFSPTHTFDNHSLNNTLAARSKWKSFSYFFHDLLNENQFYWSNNCIRLYRNTQPQGNLSKPPYSKKVYFFDRSLKVKAYLILSYQMKIFKLLSIINDIIYSHNPVITLKEYIWTICREKKQLCSIKYGSTTTEYYKTLKITN